MTPLNHDNCHWLSSRTRPDPSQRKTSGNSSWTNFAPKISVWWEEREKRGRLKETVLTFLLSFILCRLLFLFWDIWRCFSCGWGQKGQAVILCSQSLKHHTNRLEKQPKMKAADFYLLWIKKNNTQTQHKAIKIAHSENVIWLKSYLVKLYTC